MVKKKKRLLQKLLLTLLPLLLRPQRTLLLPQLTLLPLPQLTLLLPQRTLLLPQRTLLLPQRTLLPLTLLLRLPKVATLLRPLLLSPSNSGSRNEKPAFGPVFLCPAAAMMKTEGGKPDMVRIACSLQADPRNRSMRITASTRRGSGWV